MRRQGRRRWSSPGGALAVTLTAIALVASTASASMQATTRVSVASDGTQANSFTEGGVAVSADGRYVAFRSAATNLVPDDTNGRWDVFVRDTVNGTTKRVSVASDGTQANEHSWHKVSISADGRYVAFYSAASNLVPDDTNGYNDVFVHDTVDGTTMRVSVASNGIQANGDNDGPSISANGRYVAFRTASSNLVPSDTSRNDVLMHDTLGGTTTRVSVASDGSEPNGESLQPAISADGRYIAFLSHASD